ncbi:MAG: dockerin type I domain-containing protein [Pirellulales bacterium]
MIAVLWPLLARRGDACPATVAGRRRSSIEVLEPRCLLAAPEFMDGRIVGTVESAAITSASGLVASREHADVLWAHNDSGDSRLFALNSQGRHLGTYNTGVTARDWEDIAIGPGPQPGLDYLYVADTGDNGEVRSEVVVFRLAEPMVSSTQAPVTQNVAGTTAITLTYPDGPHDAETLIVDPATGDIYIVTKRDARSRIYRAVYPQATSGTTTLTYLGELTWGQAAGGDISPDGDELILKDLDDVFYYARPAGTSIATALMRVPESLPYTTQPLGEGITFDHRGMGYYTNSEGTHAALYYYQRVTTPGDVNGDGQVTRADLAVLTQHFGRASGATASQGDLNGDGKVSLLDVAILQTHYTAAPSSPGTSPEPATPVTRRTAERVVVIRPQEPTRTVVEDRLFASRVSALQAFRERRATAYVIDRAHEELRLQSTRHSIVGR